ncbi:hypothetical protein E2562_020680 [Oryza meyeriana var. granulata]|uniref:Uncharacterized protein n=1 Tax=Oryza meyeriana var. granulata TaxID=110450 RepID=A0A6G1EB82_9ORYZ|nr:hypothetical protein E2562_020680 [Oryza meyeriana var. granulata]
MAVLYYIDVEDSSYAFYEDDLSNDQEHDDTLDKPVSGLGWKPKMAWRISMIAVVEALLLLVVYG